MLTFHGCAIKLKVIEIWTLNYYNIIISIPGHMDDETSKIGHDNNILYCYKHWYKYWK